MTVKSRKTSYPKGRNQAKGANSQHGDTTTDIPAPNYKSLYGGKRQSINLDKSNFRFEARVGGTSFPLDGYVVQASWQENVSDLVLAYKAFPLQIQISGTLQMTKPELPQDKQLSPPVLSAITNVSATNDRWGAVGVNVTGKYGYGGHFTPIWNLIVQGGGDSTGGSAQEVNESDGTWTLNLVDPTLSIERNSADFKYVKGSKSHKQGWRADQIAIDICQQYQIPIKQLVRGTAWFELSGSLYQHANPLYVIASAYQKEMLRTGKVFVIRWGLPDQQFPQGGLSITPLRRNQELLVFRDQLTEAALSRDQSKNFATVIQAQATLKQGKGKTKELTYVASNAAAISRFGWIVHKEDFGLVSSQSELEILAKRWLAISLLPVRTANLTSPGVPTLQAGDAIRIDIPEEGYAPVALTALQTPAQPPTKGRLKTTAKALLAAEKSDPTLFGLPDPSVLTGTADKNINQYKDKAVAAVIGTGLNVPDAGIAFVTNIEHSVSAGTYSMDIQTGFLDRLDPRETQALVDQAVRSAKSTKSSSVTGPINGPINPKGVTGPGGGTITMYDTDQSTSPVAGIPSNAAVVAGYDPDGNGNVTTGMFHGYPNARHFVITFDINKTADCLDIEASVPNSAAGPWVKLMLSRGQSRPCVYTNLSNYSAVKASLDSAGLSRGQYRIWLANPTGTPHIPAGMDACQYAWPSLGQVSGNADVSLLLANFFG